MDSISFSKFHRHMLPNARRSAFHLSECVYAHIPVEDFFLLRFFGLRLCLVSDALDDDWDKRVRLLDVFGFWLLSSSMALIYTYNFDILKMRDPGENHQHHIGYYIIYLSYAPTTICI